VSNNHDTNAAGERAHLGGELLDGIDHGMRVETLPLHSNGHRRISRASEARVLRSNDGKIFVTGDWYNCVVCDMRPRFLVTQDEVRAEDPCPYPNGITTEITLSVPSGKLLVSDDLRPVYDWDDDGFASYNTVLGQAQVVEAMAAAGCAYGPVGNSCPGLYRTGLDTYIVARPNDDETPLLADDTCLASICTDLWAYSIADFEHWKARGGDPNKLDWVDTIVDVRPGTYRFTHHTGEAGFDGYADDTVVFAHIERLRGGE
jgi:hypothetical protein